MSTAFLFDELADEHPKMRARPVELLRDGRGVYGIGVSDEFAPLARRELVRPSLIVLRPDRFNLAKPSDGYRGAILQKINGGFRHGMFCHTAEEQLRQFIHHVALDRADLPWPPRQGRDDPAWWSHDKKQQARNRGIYHGLRLLSLGVINSLIGKAIEEAADADAIKAARRFAFLYREEIYRACAQSRRALQLTDTFPLLAAMIYSSCCYRVWDESERADWEARKKAAAKLVERGARLRDVAAAIGIPMALRCIKPGAVHLSTSLIFKHPTLLRHMPDALPRSRRWLRLVRWAADHAGADYAQWAARNVWQIPGSLDEAGAFLSDLADWVKAGTEPDADDGDPDEPWGQEERRRRQFVVRPFTPSMSLKTVTELSADWHEAVASDMSGPQYAFPKAWYPAAKIGAYEILPIDSSAELYREGAAMHHCAGTYANDVKRGYSYFYSIRSDGKRVATLALDRAAVGNSVAISQLRGPCNAQPPKAISLTVQRWLHTQPPLPPQDAPTPSPEARAALDRLRARRGV
jgi:hypothetical protein